MVTYRIDRLNKEFRRLIAERLAGSVKNDAAAKAILTHVDTSRDLSVAKVYYTLLDDADRAEAAAALDAVKGRIRGDLGRAMQIRRVPELRFVYDDSERRARSMDALIDKVIRDDRDRAAAEREATIKRIGELMGAADSWLVLSHEKPDGDTVGSAAALAFLGARLGKRVQLGCSDEYPEKYSFILRGVDRRRMESIPEDFPIEGGVVICVDTSNVDRSVGGLRGEFSRRTVINIDHHADNEMYGAVNLVEDDASSTGEILSRLFAECGWGIEKPEAEALYIAMITDNGRFSFASTSVKSHECAIALIKAGARPSELTERLDASLTMGALALWGRALSRAEVFCGGAVGVMYLSSADFEETGASRENTENLVNFLQHIKGVRLCAMLTETDAGTRVSVRAREPYNARAVASVFGGGGHDLAAGCTVHDSLANAIELVKREMSKQIEAGFSDR